MKFIHFFLITTALTGLRLLSASHMISLYLSPLETIAIFSSILFGRNILCIFSLLTILFVSDLSLNLFNFHHFIIFYDGFYWQYVAMLSLVLVGAMMIRNVSFTNTILASLVGVITFYIISNFGVFISSNLYPKTSEGFYLTYVMALPFLKLSLLNTLFFSLLIYFALKLAPNSLFNLIHLSPLKVYYVKQ